MGAISAVQTCVTTSGQTVPLTAIPVGPSGQVTGRNIYVSKAGAAHALYTDFFLACASAPCIADNTTTTFSFTLADASLGANPPSVNGTGNSQSVGFRSYVVPVQGTTTGASYWGLFYHPTSGGDVLGLQLFPNGSISLAGTAFSAQYNGTLSIGGGPFDGTTTGKFVGSVSGTSIAVNEVTGYAGNLIDLQVGGVAKVRSDYVGDLTVAGSLGALVTSGIGSASFDVLINGVGVSIASGEYLAWSSTANANGTRDTRITRSTAGVLSIDTTVNSNGLGAINLATITISGSSFSFNGKSCTIVSTVVTCT